MKTLTSLALPTAFTLALVACSSPPLTTQPLPTPMPATALPTPRQELTPTACGVGQAKPLLATLGGSDSVAVSPDGTIYTSNFCTGEVYGIQGDGSSSVLATIPLLAESCASYEYEGAPEGITGIALASDGSLWVAAFSPNPQTNGVWHVEPDGSTQLAFPIEPDAGPHPNELVLDPQGTLYITESSNGAIWKATLDEGARQWFQSDLLTPLEIAGGPHIGANGIALQDQALYVSNYARGTVIKIPISVDGTPGEESVIATHLSGPTALRFDASGQLYATIFNISQLVRITPLGEVVLIGSNLAKFGLEWPTGIDFSPAIDSNTVYISSVRSLDSPPSGVVELSLCARN